jgi:Fur family transcriptional regulator, peroxide stress response regulator
MLAGGLLAPPARLALQRELVGAGLRITPQRLAVLGGLRAMRTHPTADELYHTLVAQSPRMARGTVYRTLDVLLGAGLIARVGPAGDGGRAPQRFDGAPGHHHHLIAADGTLEDLHDPALDALLAAHFAATQRPIRAVRVEVFLAEAAT